MPAGRPRKPAKLKALSGEARPSRLQSEPQPRETEPQFPEWLGEDARPIWDRVTSELASMTLLFSADQDAIAAYVSSVALVETAERGLAEDGYATKDDHGRLHRSQWLMIRRDGLDGVHRFGSLLGLNPVARTRLPVSPPEDEESGLEMPAARSRGPRVQSLELKASGSAWCAAFGLGLGGRQ